MRTARERVDHATGLLVSFAAGAALGWRFRVELLNELVDPWVVANAILEGYPSRKELSTWFTLIPATVGVAAALPWLALLGVSLVSRRPMLSYGMRSAAFALVSYAALLLGLALATFVLYPAFVAWEKERWQEQRAPAVVPWAFVERDLCWTVGVAVACQLLVVLFVFARVERRPAAKLESRRHGTHRL